MNAIVQEKINRGDPLTSDELTHVLMSGVKLKDVFKLSEQDLSNLSVVGYELFNQGKYEDARLIFQGLNALGHDDSFVQTALGTIAARDGELEKAVEFFNRAVDSDPEDISALTNRAEVYLKLNCFDKAAEDLKAAIDLDPDDESSLSSRARVLSMITRELIESMQTPA
ncbi:tetratricopeptide repeat protein [bacterium]|nr:tetratricopeptide repeat protein [candidate division CSSED10-310 bacterium]